MVLKNEDGSYSPATEAPWMQVYLEGREDFNNIAILILLILPEDTLGRPQMILSLVLPCDALCKKRGI